VDDTKYRRIELLHLLRFSALKQTKLLLHQQHVLAGALNIAFAVLQPAVR
jgi:hypothetical protein